MLAFSKKLLILLCLHSTLLATLPWSDKKNASLAKEAEQFWSKEASLHKHLEYPIQDPSSLFDLYKSDRVLIFSYGSLLNKESASRSLSEKAMATHQSAVAFGLKRIFNRHVPTTKRWGPLERPNDTAMLNINKTQDFSKMVNGVVINVGLEDLKSLIAREEGYDLVPVVVTDWKDCIENPDSPEYVIAYTFQASDEPRVGKRYTRNDINPVPGYAHASMEGAAQYGETFLDLWLSSTYLSDRTTPFSLWIGNPEIDCVYDDNCR